MCDLVRDVARQSPRRPKRVRDHDVPTLDIERGSREREGLKPFDLLEALERDQRLRAYDGHIQMPSEKVDGKHGGWPQAQLLTKPNCFTLSLRLETAG